MHLLPRSVLLSLSADERPSPRSPWPVDEAYWLAHCEGFQVDGPDGRIGVVEHVVYESRLEVPDVVSVASGRWRLRSTDVPIADVLEVRPEQERLVVAGAWGAHRGAGWRARMHRALAHGCAADGRPGRGFGSWAPRGPR
jgi:hypothetical protein